MKSMFSRSCTICTTLQRSKAIESFVQLLDEFLNVAVMNHVARGGRRGKTSVVDAPFKIIFENREGTGVSLAHQHPVDGLLHPLVEP